MGKSSAPRPPDPAQLAQEQEAANRRAAETNLRLGAQDRFGVFGSTTFNRDESGLPTGQTVSLNAPLQSTVDQASTTASNLAGLLPQDRFTVANVLGPNRLGAPGATDISGGGGQDTLVGGGGTDTGGTASPLAQSFFDQQRALLQPGFDDQLRNFEIRAAERGLPLGSEAFDNTLSPILRAQNQALQQAAGQAIQLTPQEEQRQIQNALLERGLPFQETSSALGLLGQVPVPSFNPQPQASVAPVDTAGLAQQGFENEVALAGQRNQALSSLLGAGATIAGSAIGGPFGATLANSLFGAATGGATPQVSSSVQRAPVRVDPAGRVFGGI